MRIRMKEEDIRKRKVFSEYLELVREDSKKLFDYDSFVLVSCPACNNRDLSEKFKKNDFSFVTCRKCRTFFVNPRPSFDDLKRFYTDSDSTKFWINKFFQPVAEIRKEKMFRPRAEFVAEHFSDLNNGTIGDIGAGFGLFLEELRVIWPDADLVAIEPSTDQAEICRGKNIKVKCSAMEDLDEGEGQFDMLTSFEVFEHLYDPGEFLNHVYRLLKPGGKLLMTTLNGEGFDIQLLQENSKSITPPHHLNFFNPDSIALLCERIGFSDIRVSTPGRLDWDIVEGMIKNEGVNVGGFWGFLASKKETECKDELQNWISRNNLSSHMRVTAVKTA